MLYRDAISWIDRHGKSETANIIYVVETNTMTIINKGKIVQVDLSIDIGMTETDCPKLCLLNHRLTPIADVVLTACIHVFNKVHGYRCEGIGMNFVDCTMSISVHTNDLPYIKLLVSDYQKGIA
jgi:hypothetical protein